MSAGRGGGGNGCTKSDQTNDHAVSVSGLSSVNVPPTFAGNVNLPTSSGEYQGEDSCERSIRHSQLLTPPHYVYVLSTNAVLERTSLLCVHGMSILDHVSSSMYAFE